MALQRSDVEKIAHLARLAVSEDEMAAYTRSLSDILKLVDQMDSADVAHVAPMAHPLDAVQRLREDVVRETDQREKFQAIAPHVETGLYLVPRVIE
ncbi:MAG TPA: Asp-tRNA(Asn)/Glu-tRNA(Gln) amidotransferase subunit GatC [Gammaproteobacteria bacterium]|nr:Asp-tRNA(Asn)/Glu-tRNA(Gln) amidotransferase subunit GatC [Gammaproteobacteria bacterium]